MTLLLPLNSYISEGTLSPTCPSKCWGGHDIANDQSCQRSHEPNSNCEHKGFRSLESLRRKHTLQESINFQPLTITIPHGHLAIHSDSRSACLDGFCRHLSWVTFFPSIWFKRSNLRWLEDKTGYNTVEKVVTHYCMAISLDISISITGDRSKVRWAKQLTFTYLIAKAPCRTPKVRKEPKCSDIRMALNPTTGMLAAGNAWRKQEEPGYLVLYISPGQV